MKVTWILRLIFIPSPANLTMTEWDVSSHVEGYDIWFKAAQADGGEECRELCRLVDEPLIEGMLVGKLEDVLSVRGRKEVSMLCIFKYRL